jgi:hypothetical protein
LRCRLRGRQWRRSGRGWTRHGRRGQRRRGLAVTGRRGPCRKVRSGPLRQRIGCVCHVRHSDARKLTLYIVLAERVKIGRAARLRDPRRTPQNTGTARPTLTVSQPNPRPCRLTVPTGTLERYRQTACWRVNNGRRPSEAARRSTRRGHPRPARGCRCRYGWIAGR